MPVAVAEQREFIDLFLDALDEQEAVQAAAPTVLWQPTCAEMASVRHASMNRVVQSAAARHTASRQQMATLRQGQETVSFYYGRGVVLEQMWLA